MRVLLSGPLLQPFHGARLNLAGCPKFRSHESFGAMYGIRTRDHWNHNPVLYQLS